MKKTFVIVLLLGIGGVICSLPYWFGTQAEKIYNEQIGFLRATNQIQVTYNKFERGFLRSAAATRMDNPQLSYSVNAEHIIEHGPFPVTRLWHHVSEFHPVQALVNSKVDLVFGSQTPISGSFRTVVDVNGVATTTFNVPAQQTRLTRDYSVAWEEISGRAKLGSVWGTWRGMARSDHTRLERGTMRLIMGPSTLQFDTSVGHNELLVGTSTLTTDVLTLQTDGATERTMTVRDLVVESNSEELGARMDYQLSGRFEDFSDDVVKTGPATWNVTLRRLDSAAIMKLGGVIGNGQGLAVDALIDLVIKHKAALSASAKIASESGPVTMKVDVGFAPSVDLNQPLLAFLALQGSLRMEAPGPVVELLAAEMVKLDLRQLQAEEGIPALSEEQRKTVMTTAVPQRIQTWIDNGYVVKQNDIYVITSTLENGSLSLNDKPTDFMSWLR